MDFDVPIPETHVPFLSGRVHFVCTGNVCRSPTAAIVAQSLWDRTYDSQQSKGIVFSSSGIGAVVGHPIDRRIPPLLQSYAVDNYAHRARQTTGRMLASQELIIVFSARQMAWIQGERPDCATKTIPFGVLALVEDYAKNGMSLTDLLKVGLNTPPAPWYWIPDPYDLDDVSFTRCVHRIASTLERSIPYLRY